MKKLLLTLLLILPLLLFAETIPVTDNPDDQGNTGTSWGVGGVVGSITIGNKTYSQIRLMPELTFGKFGVGLDIDLLIDSDGNVREEDWDEWKDIINKIYYIRFAQRRDPFYFKVGSIPSYTLGNGLIFDGYSNMLLYPNVRNIGGFVGVNTPLSGLGFEVFTHNVEKNEILAGRVHFKPLAALEMPLISRLTIGANVGLDRNQFAKFKDSDGDGIPDVYDKFPNDKNFWLDTNNNGIPDKKDLDINGDGIIDHPDHNPAVDAFFKEVFGPNYKDNFDPTGYDFDTDYVQDFATDTRKKQDIMIYSADYHLPLIESSFFSLYNYGEYAMIKDYGNGFIFPGFGANISIFDMRLDFRRYGDKFLPGYFSNMYDDQRSFVKHEFVEDFEDTETGVVRDRNVYSLVPREEMLNGIKSSMGWYGSVKADLFNIVSLRIAYQDMYGKDVTTGKSIWGTLGIDPKIIPKLKNASISYSQTDVKYIDFKELRTPSAQVSGALVYGISDNTHLVGRYTERYIDLNADGKIRGNDEILKSMTFSVEFKF